MAVQNDNTVLSKGDLKAYHQRILPYLGGNNMVRTNNSDFFSTEEKVVGVWEDGKPLYQKTYKGTTPSTLTVDVSYTVPLGLGANSYTIHRTFGSCNNANRVYVPLHYINYSGGTTWFFDAYGVASRDELNIVGTSNYANCNYEITIQYTKDADAAISALTTPGAYDLTRPDLWPQNKEIFFGDGLYGYRATGNVPSNKDIAISNVSGATRFIACGGTVDNGAGANFHSFNYTNPANMPIWGTCLFANHNSGVPEIYFGTGYTTSSVYDVWFTYKK